MYLLVYEDTNTRCELPQVMAGNGEFAFLFIPIDVFKCLPFINSILSLYPFINNILSLFTCIFTCLNYRAWLLLLYTCRC